MTKLTADWLRARLRLSMRASYSAARVDASENDRHYPIPLYRPPCRFALERYIAEKVSIAGFENRRLWPRACNDASLLYPSSLSRARRKFLPGSPRAPRYVYIICVNAAIVLRKRANYDHGRDTTKMAFCTRLAVQSRVLLPFFPRRGKP